MTPAGGQIELVLAQRPCDDVLRERLADACERFNSTYCPGERIELHHEICELRKLLGLKGGGK